MYTKAKLKRNKTTNAKGQFTPPPGMPSIPGTKEFVLKVAWNYSYVASTTAINNAAASQLLTIKLIAP